jgi:ribosome-binding protein aMBF1 (putative translation factor)
MNKYEIEDVISGDSSRDEKIEYECEMCADNEMITEATYESHNMELCSDCYSEVNE